MFTGIVEYQGSVVRLMRRGGGARLEVRAPEIVGELQIGDSVAVNGACLTVERVVKGGFQVHVVETTTGRTLLGEYGAGRRVNLERALRAGDRLGGHFVQGHVDGVAVVTRAEQRGDAWVYDLRTPRAVREVAILHGAITVDGVSLTINDLPGPEADLVQISLIPFTRAHTTLGTLRVGDRVHVEGDVLGKYVRQLCRTAT